LKHAIANWAETGQKEGVGLRVWQVRPPTESVDADISHLGEVTFRSDSRFVAIAQYEREELPLLHWVANVGRRLKPTDRFVALLKEAYFAAHSAVEVTREAMAHENPVRSSLPVRITAMETARKKAAFQIRNQDRPWPPPPLPVLLQNPRQDEGLWVPVIDERVRKNTNAPEPFYQSFIRTNPEHSHKRVFITVWDPEQVALRFQVGTVEPISTTGLKGTGIIPREPKLLERVVAGFNGGFQSFHGKYGAYVDKRLFVPPFAGIATVVATDDGRTGMGTWGVHQKIAGNISDLRQNLPPLVEDGVVNPYGILKWGGSQDVPGAEGAFTIRSGMGLTRYGHIAYFWCQFCDAPGLGRAMVHAGVDYGMHLDMNSGHSGFEFYRQLSEAQSKGYSQRSVVHIEETNQYFYATRMVKNVSHMRFPRYLRRDYRDFFYLILKRVMPGPGEWQTTGLVGNANYPPAIALSRQTPNLLRVDPARFVAHVVPATNDPLAPFSPLRSEGLTLGLVLPDAVLHRCGGISLRPIRGGSKVLAIDADGRLQVLRWSPELESRFPHVVSANESAVEAGPFLDLRPAAILGYQRDGNQLLQGPINGGEGSIVTRLASTDLRILLRLKKKSPAGFRF
jgi:hypothetical protein